MSKVFCAHAVSVDGYISGRTPEGADEFGRGLGDAPILFDWYMDCDKDVALMGGGVLTSALEADLVDEVILHQVPILLGGGRPFFHSLPGHMRLRLVEVIPAPGLTHLHHEVAR
jgi:RibD C-terminal domain